MSREAKGPTANPGFQLWHATTLWKQAITEGMSALEITHTQFFLLGSLHWLSKSVPGGPNQRQLADHTGLDRMTTSQVLRTLERRGYIARREDPDDLRAYRLELTKSGNDVARKAIRIVRAKTKEFFAPLGKDVPRFVDNLRTLSRSAGASSSLVG